MAQGGRKQDFNQMKRDLRSDLERSFEAVPGLINDILLLAWTNRSKNPFIYASCSNQSDAGGSGIHVKTIHTMQLLG